MSESIAIGLISDTHSWLDPSVAEVFAHVDHIIHAGDIGNEKVLEELEEIAPVIAVRGNIDGGPLRFLPLEAFLEVHDKRIAVRHIAGNPKRPNKATRDLIARERPDILIVGHSHIPVVAKVHGTLWINPGAAGREGFHDERFAARIYVDTESGEVTMDRVHFGPRIQIMH
jgi:putative phosphoesterase